MIARAARALRARLRGIVATRRRAPPLSHTILFDDHAASDDPFAVLEALRMEGGVFHLPAQSAWLVLDAAAARRVLASPEDFSSSPSNVFDPALIGADPPRHGAVRRVVARSFGEVGIARLETVARAECERRLASRFDAVAHYARPVSVALAVALLGLDADAAGRIAAAGADPYEAGAFDRLVEALDMVADRADVHARLLADGGEVIGPDDARSIVRLLWLASTATTERATAHCTLKLATDPVLQDRLRAEASAIPRFVEETIRLFPPEMVLRRVARRDVTVAGVEIPAGGHVLLALAAANRDPAVHAVPGEIAWTGKTQSLSFGHGPHICIGGPLARRVVAVAVGRLLTASRSFQLDVAPEDVPFVRAMTVVAPRELPIRMDLATD